MLMAFRSSPAVFFSAATPCWPLPLRFSDISFLLAVIFAVRACAAPRRADTLTIDTMPLTLRAHYYCHAMPPFRCHAIVFAFDAAHATNTPLPRLMRRATRFDAAALPRFYQLFRLRYYAVDVSRAVTRFR